MLTHYPNKMMGKKKLCPVCNGKGTVWREREERFCNVSLVYQEPCPRCHGMSSQPIEHKDVNDDPVQAGN